MDKYIELSDRLKVLNDKREQLINEMRKLRDKFPRTFNYRSKDHYLCRYWHHGQIYLETQ